MTREEAINLLADMDSDKYTAKEAVALTMAIKALEQEPILDKIREEIKSKKFGLTDTEDGRRIQSDIHAGFDGGIECALQIIDKYKATLQGQKGAIRNERRKL